MDAKLQTYGIKYSAALAFIGFEWNRAVRPHGAGIETKLFGPAHPFDIMFWYICSPTQIMPCGAAKAMKKKHLLPPANTGNCH